MLTSKTMYSGCCIDLFFIYIKLLYFFCMLYPYLDIYLSSLNLDTYSSSSSSSSPSLSPPPPLHLGPVYSSGSPPTYILQFHLSLPLPPHCLLQDSQLQICLLLHNFQINMNIIFVWFPNIWFMISSEVVDGTQYCRKSCLYFQSYSTGKKRIQNFHMITPKMCSITLKS